MNTHSIIMIGESTEKLVSVINTVIENKTDKESINIIEKQFFRKGLLNDWLEFYNEYLFEKDDSFFKKQLINVIKFLILFKNLKLLRSDSSEETVLFIKKFICNIELFDIIFNRSYNMDNIVDKCDSYMNNGVFLDIIEMKKNNPTVISNTVDICKDNETDTENTVNEESDNDEPVNDPKWELLKQIVKNNPLPYLDPDSELTEEEKNDGANFNWGTTMNVKENTVDKNTENDKYNNYDTKLGEEEIKEDNSNLQNTVHKKDQRTKRKKYNKSDKYKTVLKVTDNIINNRINNKDLYKKIYEFNRNNIQLYSDIYHKYKVDCILDEKEFTDIYINFDKNKNRFLKICKIYYFISKEKKLLESNLLFLPYCFNEISIKDDCISLFRDKIIEYLDQ